MNLKKLLKKAVVQEAAENILPMDGETPKKFGKKSKAATALVVVAGIATALAEYL
jgi:hypothetical protein